MTNYSPLHDALDETGEPVTASDMVDAGYDDFEQGAQPPQMRIISALDALDGQIFDDFAKWRIVNQLVCALAEMDDKAGVESEVTLDGHGITLSFEPNGSVNR